MWSLLLNSTCSNHQMLTPWHLVAHLQLPTGTFLDLEFHLCAMDLCDFCDIWCCCRLITTLSSKHTSQTTLRSLDDIQQLETSKSVCWKHPVFQDSSTMDAKWPTSTFTGTSGISYSIPELQKGGNQWVKQQKWSLNWSYLALSENIREKTPSIGENHHVPLVKCVFWGLNWPFKWLVFGSYFRTHPQTHPQRDWRWLACRRLRFYSAICLVNRGYSPNSHRGLLNNRLGFINPGLTLTDLQILLSGVWQVFMFGHCHVCKSTVLWCSSCSTGAELFSKVPLVPDSCWFFG